jgi:transcriptional regulator of acetoin/glycerol metabolism
LSDIAVRPPAFGRATSFASALFSVEETGLYGVDRPGVAWDWMKQTGQAPSSADWVRPQVAEAWARCIEEHGLPAGVDFEPRRVLARDFDARPDNSVGAVVARLPGMVYDLRSLLDDANVTLLLADTAGRVIHLLDSGLKITAGGLPMARIGAEWRECSLGNNGVGTASLLREPVAFDGKEHFSKALHHFATAGCPIFAPDGGVSAILGMISDRRDAARLMLGFLKLARQLLEASLFERTASNGYMLRLRADETSALCLADGRIFVGADGRIAGADRTSLDLLGVSDHSRIVGEPAAEAIGVDLPTLIDASEGARLVSLEARRCGRVVRAFVHRVAAEEGAPTRLDGRAGASRVEKSASRDFDFSHESEWRDLVLETALQKATGLQERNIPILITGESGVGKDFLVRRLHATGPRKDRPLVAINCAAIPRELIESELFGYEGGSFTGARSKGKPGKFVEADKGVLFLDEIGDMALDLQATLLRVLDSREVTPIGATKPIPVDVRVVAATNCSLQDMVQKGTFRRDLYYRLNGVQLWLPPLRERPDRLRLVEHLFRLEQETQNVTGEMRFCDEAWRLFFKHPWPGNIREVRNVLRSSIAVAKGDVIGLDDLPPDFMRELEMEPRPAAEAFFADRVVAACGEGAPPLGLADWEAQAVRYALASSKGNIAKAARTLGITRATLYHKMARYGLRSDRRIVAKR